MHICPALVLARASGEESLGIFLAVVREQSLPQRHLGGGALAPPSAHINEEARADPLRYQEMFQRVALDRDRQFRSSGGTALESRPCALPLGRHQQDVQVKTLPTNLPASGGPAPDAATVDHRGPGDFATHCAYAPQDTYSRIRESI